MLPCILYTSGLLKAEATNLRLVSKCTAQIRWGKFSVLYLYILEMVFLLTRNCICPNWVLNLSYIDMAFYTARYCICCHRIWGGPRMWIQKIPNVIIIYLKKVDKSRRGGGRTMQIRIFVKFWHFLMLFWLFYYRFSSI